MERRDDENREMMIQAISSLVYEQWERLNRDPYLVPVGISARHVHLSREHVAQNSRFVQQQFAKSFQ